MADQLLKELGVADGVVLQLNTLGDAASRDKWRAALIEHFRSVAAELSEDSQQRLEHNPLRILDSKEERDRRFVADAPQIDQFLSGEAQDFFGAVTGGLDAAGVAWTRNPALVRGLDYYRHTAFEFVTDRLGAQGTVLGGGRYDGLMESLGGPATPAVGWAAGIERLAMLVDEPGKPLRSAAIVLETDSRTAHRLGREMASLLRSKDMPVALVVEGNIKKRFERARRLGTDYVLVIGHPDEEMTISLRLKRYVNDRYNTRGRIYIGLRNLLRDRFHVPTAEWKEIARRGGELRLNLRRPQ